MRPSKRQQAIFDCWEKEDTNILIRAVAGSGKTTTLMQLMQRSGKKTLFLAFNKSIQTEINEKIIKKGIDNAKAFTMHSVGLGAIRKADKHFEIKNNKNFNFAIQISRDYKWKFEQVEWEKRMPIMIFLMNMNDVSRMFLTDNYDEVVENMWNMGYTYPQIHKDEPTTSLEKGKKFFAELFEAIKVMRYESYEMDYLEIDFTDMIYLPVISRWRFPVSPKHLMIDEAQDLNILQHRMIDMIIAQGDVEKWIAVGDSNQSIYGFAGAYTGSFNLFLKKENVKELPLDICYRCPQSVLIEANAVFDCMTGFKQEPGVVQEYEVKDVSELPFIPDGALVVCRNTSPLIKLYFLLLGQDRKVFLKGEDLVKEMRRFMGPYKKHSMDYTYGKLRRDLKKLQEAAFDSDKKPDFGAKSKYYKFKESMENFVSIKNFLQDEKGMTMVRDMLDHMDQVFNESDSTDGITLCTIHKSKGLEAEIVFILNESLIPSKMAISQDMQLQEKNLKYVARTRASEQMHYLHAEELIKNLESMAEID